MASLSHTLEASKNSEVQIEVQTYTETIESEVEDEEDSFFQDIYLLAENGIPVEDIEKLRKNGINTIKGLQMTTFPNLQKLGLDAALIKRIQEISQKISISSGFMTALEVSEERKQIFKIGTGSSNLDKLLGGGIESMALTQFFGESGTGKTQLAHTLCVTAQIPTEGYPGGKVMFIDTEHTFRPQRIRHIARRFSLNENNVLENILYARAFNSEHQFELLKNVSAKFHEEVGVFRVLIVDSIMSLFRVDFHGRGELTNRQQKIAQMMSFLQKISEEYNVAVFLTNHIMSDVNNKFPLVGSIEDELKPTGGNILAHASTTRVALKKIAGNVRIAKLYDSPELEEREEAFIITMGGIDDPKLPE